MRHTKIVNRDGLFILKRKGEKNSRVRDPKAPPGVDFLVSTDSLYDIVEVAKDPKTQPGIIARKLGIQVPAFMDSDVAAYLAERLYQEATLALWESDQPLYREVIQTAMRLENRAVS